MKGDVGGKDGGREAGGERAWSEEPRGREGGGEANEGSEE